MGINGHKSVMFRPFREDLYRFLNSINGKSIPKILSILSIHSTSNGIKWNKRRLTGEKILYVYILTRIKNLLAGV